MQPGELVVILGANGAGKTTLLKATLGMLERQSGNACIGEQSILDLDVTQRALQIAYLPQMRPLAWPCPVTDVVALGRFAYGAHLGQLKEADVAAVEQALIDCDLAHLATRPTDQLSGGELARVHCARAFAASTPWLIADEPTASLDPYHQICILQLLKAYTSKGCGALVVLHNIDLAAKYADQILWMHKGQVIASGPPQETLTEDNLKQVFNVQAQVNEGRVTIKGIV